MEFYGLTIEELAAAIRDDPDLLGNSMIPFPTVIDADTVRLLEAGIGYKTNFYALLPPSNLNKKRPRFELPLNQLLDTAQRQVEVLARVLQALSIGMTKQAPLYTPMTHRLFRTFITPSLSQLPLGKKYRDDWLQQDVHGQPLAQWLETIRQSVRVINGYIPLARTQQNDLEVKLRKIDQQIEWAISRDVSSVAKPVAEAPVLQDTL